jgi:hypothetical protein
MIKEIGMSDKGKTVCECTNCGNEAEMVVKCTYEPPAGSEEAKKHPNQVRQTLTCSQCGSEADIWVDVEQK